MPQPVVKSLEKMLDFCVQKQKTISKNIANVGTENYRREDVSFKEILDGNIASEIKSTNNKHFTFSNQENQFEITKDNSEDLASGINNVDIDREMAELAENTLKFKFAARKMSSYYKNIQNVIKGSSR